MAFFLDRPVRSVIINDGNGDDVTTVIDGTARRLHVDANVNINNEDKGEGCVPGNKMRYERLGQNQSINPFASGFTTVYQITENSVFYKMLFTVNSDNIYIQIEIDGVDIFPTPDGILLEDLEDLFGSSSGTGKKSKSSANFSCFDLTEVSSNVWCFAPQNPLCINSSFKLKLKSSNSKSSRKLDDGRVVRRSLV